MSLEDNVKEDIKLFESVRKDYELLNEVIAGRTTLSGMAEDYSLRFEEFTRMQTKNILKVMKIRQDIQQYESELSMLEQMVGKLDPLFSSLTYSVENYTQARKSLEKFNKGKRRVIGGTGAAFVGFLLLPFVPPLGAIPCIIALVSAFGGVATGMRGGYLMATTDSDMSVDDIMKNMTNYFNELSKSATDVDHRIGLAYAAERFSKNREAFGRDYLSFSDAERKWCKNYLESAIPLGMLSTSQMEFENCFKALDGKANPT